MKGKIHNALALAATLLAGMAHGQQRNGFDRPPGSEQYVAGLDRIDGQAFNLATKARDALRARQFVLLDHLVTQSLALTESIGTENYRAREVLAESYLLQGKYGLVMAEAMEFKEGVGDRFAMTTLLAMIGQGRREEVRARLLRRLGTASAPTDARDSLELWEVPMDNDPSDAALAATARLVRAAWDRFDELRPETLEDLQEVARLYPSSGVVHLLLAKHVKGDADCLAELQRAAAIGSARVQKMVPKRIDALERYIWQRDHPKG